MLSRKIVFWRPIVSVPKSFELKPAKAAPLKNWPARLPSPEVLRLASGTPLLLISDFGASASLPEVGLKPISRLKMKAQSSVSFSLPRTPTFDCDRPFDATVLIDLLLCGAMM
jgi:hypothetical protein